MSAKVADITYQDKTILLAGELDFFNVAALYAKSMPFIIQNDKTFVDFSRLSGSNSAGIALMVEWLKLARRLNKTVEFKSVPAALGLIASAAGLDGLITH